jgi:hypothetical protein
MGFYQAPRFAHAPANRFEQSVRFWFQPTTACADKHPANAQLTAGAKDTDTVQQHFVQPTRVVLNTATSAILSATTGAAPERNGSTCCQAQDTFGNVGNLRLPAQHTAPGTFVNSAGAGLNRINANATGNNPFLNTQFTGMPQQNRMAPAQTGPVGGFAANPYGGANPFGAQQPQQQQQQRQPGASNLIDL